MRGEEGKEEEEKEGGRGKEEAVFAVVNDEVVEPQKQSSRAIFLNYSEA